MRPDQIGNIRERDREAHPHDRHWGGVRVHFLTDISDCTKCGYRGLVVEVNDDIRFCARCLRVALARLHAPRQPAPPLPDYRAARGALGPHTGELPEVRIRRLRGDDEPADARAGEAT